jgi:hypothetical protein
LGNLELELHLKHFNLLLVGLLHFFKRSLVVHVHPLSAFILFEFLGLLLCEFPDLHLELRNFAELKLGILLEFEELISFGCKLLDLHLLTHQLELVGLLEIDNLLVTECFALMLGFLDSFVNLEFDLVGLVSKSALDGFVLHLLKVHELVLEVFYGQSILRCLLSHLSDRLLVFHVLDK